MDQKLNMFLTEKSFCDIIEYYEDENQHNRSLAVCDLAISQFNYRAEFYITKAKILSKLKTGRKSA